MRYKSCLFFLSAAALSGCAGSPDTVPDPSLLKYPGLAETSGDKQLAAARQDLVSASMRCRVIHNNYEKNSKNAEQAKLTIGAIGGVAGFTGAMLVAGGTGGLAAGIAAGVAGVASAVLATSEKGPLGTAFYTAQKEGIAIQIQRAADASLSTTTASEVYAIATGLTASCLAAEPLGASK